MRGATLRERILHRLGYHFTKGRLGLIVLSDRYFRLADSDVFSVRCTFCDKEVKNPFHKLR